MKKRQVEICIRATAKLYKKKAVEKFNNHIDAIIIEEVEASMINFLATLPNDVDVKDVIEHFAKFYENGFSFGNCTKDYYIKSVCCAIID